MNLYPLINLLSDGKFQTGTQLGLKLGISRTAVWKQIQQLEGLGIEVITKKNEGYCLSNPLDLLNFEKMQADLAAANSSLTSEFYPVIDSTNLEFSRRISAGELFKHHLILAEMQTAGRGRRGRDWFSPYASSLSMSICWRIEAGANALQGLSLAVGVVIKDALSKHGIPEVKLKWPNDLYLNSAKVGGILIELSGDLAGPCNLVVGFGLNIYRQEQMKDVDQPIAFLSDATTKKICRTSLAIDLALAVEKLLEDYPSVGFQPLQNAWNSAHVWQGMEANLITPVSVTPVTLGGVNELGELQVTYSNGKTGSINSGEISVRAAE